MFRLIRAVLLLILLLVLAYVAATVPLGQKTLWQHLHAIAETDESQQLVEGVKEKAGEVLHQRSSKDQADNDSSVESATPQDNATEQERERLKRLVKKKLEGV